MDLSAIGIQTNFGPLDWCIVVGYLLVIVAVGVYIKRYISSVTDFIVAGRGLRTFLAIATMIGTELGLVTVMYSAQKGFTGGFAAFHIALAAAIVTLVVGLTGFIVVPLRRMKVMTIPEFYERRFGRGVRILGGILLAFSGILNMGMFLKAGAIFVMGITNIGVTNLTPDMELALGTELKVIMTILLGCVLLYTALGGMVSVVVLDYIQFVVLSFSLLAASLLSIRHLGWQNIIGTVSDLKGAAGFNPFHPPPEGFGTLYVVWMFFLGLVSCAIWQTAVIRACAAESIRVVKKLYIWSSIGFLIRFLLPYFFGISALVFIVQSEPLRGIFLPEGALASPDITLMAMPVFLGQILPAGLIGIVCAGMLAAFMSTHDSYLLCWSSVLTQDVVSPWFKNGLSSKTRLLLTRIFILAIGIFILVWGLWYPLGQDLWDYMAISGAIYFTGAIALLVCGLYWKRASKVGAYSALVCGFLAVVGLTPVQNWLGFILNPVKLYFGFTKEIPIEKITEKTVLVVKDVPIEQITAKTVLVYDTIGSEIVGLTVIALATFAMIVGSLAFPDDRTSSEA
ncbi:MAG: sodium:solute symporter family protein [Phycisphaerales bacterium]|nr:MAG: sodium:solute symporter family protein [Phycisphaerales bacterium]